MPRLQNLAGEHRTPLPDGETWAQGHDGNACLHSICGPAQGIGPQRSSTTGLFDWPHLKSFRIMISSCRGEATPGKPWAGPAFTVGQTRRGAMSILLLRLKFGVLQTYISGGMSFGFPSERLSNLSPIVLHILYSLFLFLV